MSELSEAAERLREMEAVSEHWASKPMDERRAWNREWTKHAAVVVAACLVEHHADDGDKLNSPEAIDWLDGLSRVDGDGLPMLTVQLKDDGLHLVNNNWVSPRVATKGDVRTLCRALGIELQETRDG